MKKLLFTFTWLLLTITCSAEIIIVDDDWPYDFDNIQEAIDYSSNWDTIFVFPGTYTGEGNRAIDFNGKAITIRSVDPEDPYLVSITIIDCNGISGGFHFQSGEDANSVIDGLTIINGFASDGGAISCYGSSPTITNCIISDNFTHGRSSGGSGISMFQSLCLINNCTITGNTAENRQGGGVLCYDSTPTITNCNITGNSARYGGGIYCEDSSPIITNCTIAGNSAEEDGGGIYNRLDSSLTLNNCTITGNTADSGNGGGVHCYMSESTITNCTINDNNTVYGGGGIYGDESTLMLTNCTFTGNTGEIGGGIYSRDSIVGITNCTVTGNLGRSACGGAFGDTLSITNSILWGNTDSTTEIAGPNESAQLIAWDSEVTFSCIQDDDPNDANIPFADESNSNIDDDPMFMRNPNDGGDGWGDNPETPEVDEGANDDFGDVHLQIGSPCINAGLPNFWAGPNNVDIDGQQRIVCLRVDMGVDEVAPMILVTKPQGSEVWTCESRHEIKWVSFGVSGTVDIYYSSNNGTDWVTIDSDIADTGSYIWYLPDMVDSNQCIVSVVPGVPDPNVACIESGLFTIHPDFIHPTVPSKWKSLGGDFDRAGLSVNYGPELGCVKWQFETNGPVSASITIGAGDRVQIACEDGSVYTLDSSDGSLLWSYDTNSPLLSSATVGPSGSVYVGNKNGKLYAISIGGNLRWTHTTDGFIYSSPAVSPDTNNIYVCSEDGVLYALGRDGSELWSFETDGFGVIGGSIFASPAIDVNGTVYIAGLYDPNLYALDPNNGSVKWACTFESGGWPFASPVVAEDGVIYQTMLYDANLYAINPSDGNVIWSTHLADPCSGWFEPYYTTGKPDVPQYHLSDSSWSEPALGPDGTIYVSFEDPYLRAVDPNGTIDWVTRLGMMGGFTLTVGSDGLIYATSDDAHLYVVSPDGDEIARFEGYDWLSFPVIAEDNTIIVSDANNTVWAIGGASCEEQIAALHRPQDLDTDWFVDLSDFALLAADWLDCTDTDTRMPCGYSGEEIYLEGDVNRDLYVDFADLAALVERWLSED